MKIVFFPFFKKIIENTTGDNAGFPPHIGLLHVGSQKCGSGWSTLLK